jgi:porin
MNLSKLSMVTFLAAASLFINTNKSFSEDLFDSNIANPVAASVTIPVSEENQNVVSAQTTANSLLAENQEITLKKEDTQEETGRMKSWIEGDYATGDWGGLRSKLEEKGLTLEVTYTSDQFIKLHGGLDKKHPLRYLGLIDTNLIVDTEKMGLWKGGTFDIRYQNLHGHGLTRNHIGDYQGYDSLDYGPFNQLSEYWYQQSLFDNKFRIKIGKQDANFDFISLENGFNYVNSSWCFPLNIPFPSYPAPSLGVMASVEPTDWLALRAGIYDGALRGGLSGFDTAFDGKDGAFIINELGIKPTIKDMPGNYLFGWWLHTGDVDEISDSETPQVYGTNYGFYTQFEQMVYKEKADAENDEGLRVLGQYSWAPSNRTELTRYYGAGLQYKGLVPSRDEDILGMSTNFAKFSHRLRALENMRTEVSMEWFYKMQLTPWLSIEPDIQYIIKPSGNGSNAVVMGVRSVINF